MVRWGEEERDYARSTGVWLQSGVMGFKTIS